MSRCSPVLFAALLACNPDDEATTTPSLCDLLTEGGFETITAGQDDSAPTVDLVSRVITIEIGELNYGWVFFDVATADTYELGTTDASLVNLYDEDGEQPALVEEDGGDDCDAMDLRQVWSLQSGRYQLEVYGSTGFTTALLPL